MEIKLVKRIIVSVFVDGFVCSAGVGALVDYARTNDSIQFVFGATLIALGALNLWQRLNKVNDEEAKTSN